MKLLVDIGNTRLKAALWDGAVLRPLGALTHARPADVDFSTLWAEAPARIERALVASVAGAPAGRRLADAIGQRFGVAAEFLASRARLGGVRNAYAQPERLGIDRLLGLVALHALEPAAYVLAGCGTALTLDALAGDGAHLGGLICASPALMIDALTGATARLAPPPVDAAIVEIATDTAGAIRSGAWLAAAALVERFAVQARRRLGDPLRIVLTGGGSEALGRLLASAHRVEPDLVLRGLAVCAESAGSTTQG